MLDLTKVVSRPAKVEAPKLPAKTSDSKSVASDLLQKFGGDLDQAINALRVASRDLRNDKVKAVVPTGKVLISLKNVSKTYKLSKQKVAALNDVSLDIHEGEFVALTGPSGSGKSTLLQLIGALDKPSEGEITINDQNIKKLSDRKLSIFRNQTIGFVFQFFYLQPFLKTKVNLEVPGMFARTRKSVRQARVQELGTAVGLQERMEHLPKELSGGQMQRAAIARALLNNPKVLLADEPTGNLDRANGEAIIDLFELVRKKYGMTVIVVTHDPEVAATADREIRLLDGRIVV